MQKKAGLTVGLFLPFSIMFLLECREEEQSILPGVPENIRFINIFPGPRTNSHTIIANGKNVIEFLLEFQDANRQQLYSSPDPVRLLINGTEELAFPYHFRTAKPGKYKITVKGASPEVLIRKEFEIEAIEEPVYDLVTLPVVFHYVRSDSSPWTAEEQQQLQKVLFDTLDQVNTNFANLSNAPDPNAINSYIRFELATHDPVGTLLFWPGMDFMHVPGLEFKTFGQADSLALSGNYWDPTKYINVYILNLEFVVGFAYYYRGASHSPLGLHPFSPTCHGWGRESMKALASECWKTLDLSSAH